MRNLTTHKILIFVLVMIPIVAGAAITSRVTTFSDGQILTAAQLNNEFNNLLDGGINNIDNANISTGANISASKLAASIAGSGLTRDGSTGVLSVNTDDVTIEVGGLGIEVVDGSITAAKLDTDSVTTVKIEDDAVTTAKIDDGAVTAAKLAAVNYAISASDSGSFSTSSTAATGVAITNLTVSLTTTGRPVLITMQSNTDDSSLVLGGSVDVAGDNGSIFFRRDSTNLIVMSTGGDAARDLVPCSAFTYLDIPAAGTYTYTARASVQVGGAVLTVRDCKLVAREL